MKSDGADGCRLVLVPVGAAIAPPSSMLYYQYMYSQSIDMEVGYYWSGRWCGEGNRAADATERGPPAEGRVGAEGGRVGAGGGRVGADGGRERGWLGVARAR